MVTNSIPTKSGPQTWNCIVFLKAQALWYHSLKEYCGLVI